MEQDIKKANIIKRSSKFSFIVAAFLVLIALFCAGAPPLAQGGEDPTGFNAPPPIMDERSGGLKKDEMSGGARILNYWLTVPGDVRIGQTFDYGPWANYGYVEKAMMWDVNGYVMGGYTKTTAENVRITTPYRLYIEKWDRELSVWNKISDQPSATGGQAGFREQGHYRLTVLPAGTAFKLAPQYRTVTVTDPKLDRKGSLIYYEITTKLPAPYSGLGMTISGKGKPQKLQAGSDEWRPDCGQYTIDALARQGVVDWESSGARMMKSSEKPEYYKDAAWVLRGADGNTLSKRDKAESYLFDANYWGDGQYSLETHLAEGDQGRGIQTMPVQPAITYITVHDCGKGKNVIPEPVTKAFEGSDSKKETVNISDIDPNKFVQLGANNVKQVPQAPPVALLNPNLPNDTPNPPALICRDCPKLQQQISHRNKQLQIPCDPPGILMEQMLKAPKRYDDMEKDYAREWDAAVTKIQALREPFTKLILVYKKMIETAYKEGLVISAEDQKNYKPMDKDGNPSVVGKGIPVGYCVFDKEQVKLVNQLREEQKKLYEDWLQLRLAAEKRIPELKKELDAANERFNDYYKALGEMRSDLGRIQTSLSDMYYSGKYEHCLGGGGERTSQNYEIVGDDGKKERGAAWGLPGMNLQLPEAKKKKIDTADLKVPKPLHEMQPLKLKWDGIRQLEIDSKLLASLAEASRLQYEAEYGSWSNWVKSKLLWLGNLAVEIEKYNPLIAPVGYMANFISNVNSGLPMEQAINQAYQESYGAMGDAAKTAGAWMYDGFFSKPFNEQVQMTNKLTLDYISGKVAYDVVSKVFEGLGDDVAKYVYARNDVLKEIEKNMDELNDLDKEGNTQEANSKRLALNMRQIELWKKMEEGGEAMDNLILTAGTSATALGIGKIVSDPKVALNGIREFLKEGVAISKKLGLAAGEKATLAARSGYIDDMAKAGQGVSSEAAAAVREAEKSVTTAGAQLDDAMRLQKEADKQLADKLDDAVAKKQEKIAGMDPPGQWEKPKDTHNVTGAQIDHAGELGSGATGTVRDLGDGRAVKIFNKGTPEQRAAKFKDEVDGLSTLRDEHVPHIPAESVGMAKVSGTEIRPTDTPVIIKNKFTANQSTLSNVIDKRPGKKMTRQEMIEALEFYNQAAKKGVVFGDANSGNLVKEIMPDGSFRYLATEGGSVAKVADPKQAREMMAELFTRPADSVNHLDDAVNEMANTFERIGGQKGEEIFNKFFENGFSLSDGNIAKHIDKDLLQAFKDPAAWEKMVKDSRRANALANPAQYVDDAGRAGINALQQRATSNQGVVEAAENVARRAAAVERQIMEVGERAPSAAQIQQVENMERTMQRGGDGLDDYFGGSFDDISFNERHNKGDVVSAVSARRRVLQ
jgi:hypothetical protein